MKIWFDTEFNAFAGEFISIGMVDEEGRTFYQATHTTQPYHPWVADNVIRVLNINPISMDELKALLERYLKHPAHTSLEIIADHPADVEHFARLIQKGNAGDWMWLPPLKIELAMGLGSTAKTSAIPHNALADACALRDAYLKARRGNPQA